MSGDNVYRDQAAQNCGNARQDDRELMECDIRPREGFGDDFDASVCITSRRIVRARTENTRGSTMLGSIFEGQKNVSAKSRVRRNVVKNIGHDPILILQRKERFVLELEQRLAL